MSNTPNTVGFLGASDIGTEIILNHGDSHIRGILRNIIHDVEKIENFTVAGKKHTVYDVTTTLDISGVVVYGLTRDTALLAA